MRNIETDWVYLELLDVPGLFQAEVGGHSVVAQTLFRRGIRDLAAAKGFFDPRWYQPAPPPSLPGIPTAAQRVLDAVRSRESILIWGDFDVDGQTSTTLLVTALREIGANVQHYIPNRASESHGITLAALADQIQRVEPGLLITCDTGIDAVDAVAFANSRQIDVIITDHHQPPQELPSAFSIVSPVLLAADHPLAHLPGVGVAYKLIEAVFSALNRTTGHLLDLVALGIVADVAPLLQDNRYLVQLGLPQLQATHRLGLAQLYQNAKISPAEIGVDEIAFGIAPRLNALGRLADANSCVDFFTSSDPVLVTKLASQLEMLNLQRQSLTDEIFQSAQAMIAADPTLDSDHPVLVLLGPPDWHPGVIGIVASRLVERYQKPVVMLTDQGESARGSARSVPGIGIADLIDRSQDLLFASGGHPMAAGLSLPSENVIPFRHQLSSSYLELYSGSPTAPEITLDGELPFRSITGAFVADIARLAPFGAGNPKLLFSTRNVSLQADKPIGKNGNHRKLSLADSSGSKHDFLWWNSADIDLPPGQFDIAYTLDLTSYKGKPQIQATLQHFRPSGYAPAYVAKSLGFEIVDHRQSQKPLKTLSELIEPDPEAVIWAEYQLPAGFGSVPRTAIPAAETLVVWSTPPSLSVFKAAVEKAAPRKVVMFAQDPGFTSLRSFLDALVGMLKHIEQSGKAYDPTLLAQRIAQTESAVECGLSWLHQHGDFDLSELRSKNIVAPGAGRPLPDFAEIDQRLKLILHEIKAYRTYFKSADLQSLF